MPIYEYACEKCGHEFERDQRMTDAPVKTCPECKGRKVTKLISRSSFVLKGGGWYADGYSDAKKKKSADSSSESSSSSNSESSSGSDSDGASKKSDSKPKDASTKKGKAGKSSKSAA